MIRSLILVLSIFFLMPLLEAWQESPARSAAVVAAVAPVYPPIALTANESGDVEVVVMIDKTGSVTSVDFLSGNPLLHKAAVEAAKRWKFEKMTKGAKLQLIFSFRMVSKDTSAEDMTPVFMPPYHLEVRGKLTEPTINYEPSGQTPAKR
jgi:TonB family protein